MQGTSELLIIIPAWNEEAVLGGVLDELLPLTEGADILVVSDGSTDHTVRVARERGVSCLDLPLNLGVGGAMRAGFLHAYRYGYEWALQLDADGQHDPREIPTLVAHAKSSGADVVIGARFAGKGEYSVRGPRWWAMRVLATVLSAVCGTTLTDTTSGFKLMSRRAIEIFARDYPAEYLGDTVEALVIARRSGLHISQVPVAMRPRAGGEPSQSPLRAARFLIRAWFALLISLTRRSLREGQRA
ncbi:glycosyltransferase family 2 protein [Schaalia sp. Marseille-Q2122]|uniref:glycosyltransferase family 2 protein n=1 Tax=Schaalia sp. Marseille-Q2122 TaxID=2736604 RepID=UPI00158AC54D|nr:glycosyltransferase family 2 protein [Schaalia sp. Marseille-Q2122]